MRLFSLLLVIPLFILGCKPDDEPPQPTPPIEIGFFQKTLNVDATVRDYLLYIPENYTGEQAVPLVLSFHGRGGNMQAQYNKTQFNLIADTTGFILLTPQATKINGENRWNPSQLTDGLPNDAGFINALIDEVSAKYSINPERIYCAGASNGGFFSFEVGCQFGQRIAAITSVMGAMNESQLSSCVPSRPIPILQIHGTQDTTVTYTKAEEAINFWIAHNQTSSTPMITAVPDTNPDDGSTVLHFLYDEGNNETVVEHYQVIGGEHDWPGHKGNMDIHASIEAWKFFSKYDINGRIE